MSILKYTYLDSNTHVYTQIHMSIDSQIHMSRLKYMCLESREHA